MTADPLDTSIARLNEIYDKSIDTDDCKTALATQKELNKLHNLYKREKPIESNLNALKLKQELDTIAEHLRPLELAADEYPLSEVARIAAEMIRKGVDG